MQRGTERGIKGHGRDAEGMEGLQSSTEGCGEEHRGGIEGCRGAQMGVEGAQRGAWRGSRCLHLVAPSNHILSE